ncbi:hypothetical protein LCGC14_1584720 [marine sediment metagenome]|uniref:Major tropism determinant N-terminal domain-containing protein n=1 Tax=marine sediment metagenome TaxID=412755 RepID=A0A0F9IFS8_9ZZZZ
MSEARIYAQQQNVGRTSEGNYVGLRGTRDGTLYTAPWEVALVLEGNCYAITDGEATAPVAQVDHAATIDIAKPSVLVTVPNLAVIMPMSLYIAIEDTIVAGLFDIHASASDVYDNAVTNTNDLTIQNIRTDRPNSSRCTAYGKVTAGGTTAYTGNSYDFWNVSGGALIDNAVAAAGGESGFVFKWNRRVSGVAPIIVGEGNLSIYCATSTDANTTFISAAWVELPENAIS